MAFIRNSSFYYNKIWVVESLPKHEKQTGTILFNDLIKRKAAQSNVLTSAMETVNTKRNLVRFLKRVESYVTQKRQLPYLHLEIHGSPKGLVLASDETISWEELAGHLRNINIATRNNLMVSLASCFGGYMFTEISPIIEAPFCGIIGPFMEVGLGEIEEGFNSYFDRLLSGYGLDNAVLALNESCPANPKFRFIAAEGFFETIRRDLARSYHDPEFMKARVYELTARALKNRETRNTMSIWDIKARIENFMNNGREQAVEEMMQTFLMKDLPPHDFSNARPMRHPVNYG